MAGESGTVAEIVKELRDEPLAENGAKPWLHYLADRIESAHEREVAELRECLREAIDMTCENNGTCSDCPIFGEQHGDCNIYKWRKALEGANRGS